MRKSNYQDSIITALAKYFDWDVKSEQSREIRLALAQVERETLTKAADLAHNYRGAAHGPTIEEQIRALITSKSIQVTQGTPGDFPVNPGLGTAETTGPAGSGSGDGSGSDSTPTLGGMSLGAGESLSPVPVTSKISQADCEHYALLVTDGPCPKCGAGSAPTQTVEQKTLQERCDGCPYDHLNIKTMFEWYRESQKPHPCHKREGTKCQGSVEFIAEMQAAKTPTVCSFCVGGKVNRIEGGTAPCPKCAAPAATSLDEQVEEACQSLDAIAFPPDEYREDARWMRVTANKGLARIRDLAKVTRPDNSKGDK